MSPFWSSSLGGYQVNIIEVELNGSAVMLIGGPFGAIEITV